MKSGEEIGTKNEIYDIIIIGGGVSGFGAALYSGRFKMRSLVLSKDTGGVLNLANHVDNYPGVPGIAGIDLADKIKDHALKFGAEIKLEEVFNIEKKKNIFIVSTIKNKYSAKSIVISTGAESKKLGVPGEKKFWGKGVHSCAMCDGYIYKGKTVGIIGGADTACKDALILADLADKVYIIYRKEIPRCEPILLEEIMHKDNIEIIPSTQVKEILGEDTVTHAILDKSHEGSHELMLDGLFIAIGHTPLSELSKKLGVHINERSEIIIDKMSRTNIEGIYAAGDVTDTPFKQAIVGVAQGVTAAYSAFLYIKKNR